MRRAACLAAVAAVALAGLVTLATPADAGGPTAYIDVTYRKGTDGPFQGKGQKYPSCGGGPFAKVKRGKSATFELRMKNKGNSNTVDVTLSQLTDFSDHPDLVSKFFYNGNNVTGDAGDGTFVIQDLPPKKSSKIFRIKAKVQQSATPGDVIFSAPFVDSPFFGSPDDCASLNMQFKS